MAKKKDIEIKKIHFIEHEQYIHDQIHFEITWIFFIKKSQILQKKQLFAY